MENFTFLEKFTFESVYTKLLMSMSCLSDATKNDFVRAAALSKYAYRKSIDESKKMWAGAKLFKKDVTFMRD